MVLATVAVGCADEASTPGSTPRNMTSGDRGPAASLFPRAVHLADGRLADGRVIALRAIRDDGGACLLVVGIDTRTRGCGRVPQGRDPPVRPPVRAEATVTRKGTAHVEVFAVTSARVARVRLLVRGAERAPAQSLLLRADGAAAIKRAGIATGPFAYFYAELPRHSAGIRAIAFDARGHRIGATDFGHLARMGERFILG
ncbi:MAG: hypothetical protein Q8K79_19340 [Solirubrobacteraceae bacterium]|nr:hypothetical protein [Solirubrobacteraceae bacterium]